MSKGLPQPFKYRGRWRVQVTLKNFTRPFKDFDDHAEAKSWITTTLAESTTEHMPEIGGPVKATLAEALVHYAGLNSITKLGVDGELNRINHYLADTDMPLLRATRDENGSMTLERYTPKSQPKGWQEHNDKRRALRRGTYEAIAALGRKRCSTITTAELRRLMTTMKSEGLSVSTIQKEIALLKALFNVCIKEWKWLGFENPALTLKLGKSESRFIFITAEQEQALWKAIGACDNPYFWPLVVCSLETTLRQGSLLNMRWDKTDLRGRVAQVPSKTGDVMQPLSKHVVSVLSEMPRTDSALVFPMTKNAVKMAWNGVRDKALLPWLQFKDIRHLGATEYARRGVGVHALRRILGHKTNHMAEVYVNLVASDILAAMDATAKVVPVIQIPPPSTGKPTDIVKVRRSTRLVKALEVRMSRLKTGVKDGSDVQASQPASSAVLSEARRDDGAVPPAQADGLKSEVPVKTSLLPAAPETAAPAASQADSSLGAALSLFTAATSAPPPGNDETFCGPAPVSNVIQFKRRGRAA